MTFDELVQAVAEIRGEVDALLPNPYQPYGGFTAACNAVRVVL